MTRGSQSVIVLSVSVTALALACSDDKASTDETKHCAPGTALFGRECVAVETDASLSDAFSSSKDTGDRDDTSNPDAGTALEYDAAPPCAPGTSEDPSTRQCVITDVPFYSVRTPATVLRANGFSTLPIVAVGDLSDAGVSTDSFVFALSREDAGVITPSSTKLTAFGTTDAIFKSCNAVTDPTCAGPVRITMARATDPAAILTTSLPINLVTPSPVGDLVHCPAGASSGWVKGEKVSSVVYGERSFPSVNLANYGDGPYGLTLFAVTGSESWTFYITSGYTAKSPLFPTVFESTDQDSPFFRVSSPVGGSCYNASSRFQIYELTRDKYGDVVALAFAFEQRCNGGDDSLSLGCLRFVRP